MRSLPSLHSLGLLLLLGLVPVLWSVHSARATDEGPRIDSLEVDLDANRVLVSFALTGAVDERFVERVQSGLPTAFVYRFELIRGRWFWFDKLVDSNTLQVVAMYDAVKQEYLVNFKLGGKLVKSRMVRDLAELERVMTRFEQEPVFTLTEVLDSPRIHLRVRAELGAKTLFSLIPAKITTDWVESRRIFAPDPQP